MSKKPEDYTVGYGKPPKHSRFHKGRSGNPEGRPRGKRNLKTDLAAELDRRIDIREGEHRRRVSKQEALIKRLVEKSLSGDPRAMTTTLNLMVRAFGIEDTQTANTDLVADDQDILAAFVAQKSQTENVGSSVLNTDTASSRLGDTPDGDPAEELKQGSNE